MFVEKWIVYDISYFALKNIRIKFKKYISKSIYFLEISLKYFYMQNDQNNWFELEKPYDST